MVVTLALAFIVGVVYFPFVTAWEVTKKVFRPYFNKTVDAVAENKLVYYLGTKYEKAMAAERNKTTDEK